MSCNWRKMTAAGTDVPNEGVRSIVVRRAPGASHRGMLQLGELVMPCALGGGGIGPVKREGDGCTPLADMAVLAGFWRADRLARPRTRLPMRPIARADGWCDAPADRNYNRPVRLPYPASHERMWRTDGLYDICIVLDWNIAERRRGLGSCIFLHMARPGYLPTEGCVALSPPDMARLLPLLRKGTRLRVLG